MCGIVAVLRRRSARPTPDLGPCRREVEGILVEVDRLPGSGDPAPALRGIADRLHAVDQDLRGVPGLSALLADRVALAALEHSASALERALAALEARIDAQVAAGVVPDVEAVNAALVGARDAAWAIARDRLRTARAVDDLAGGATGVAALEAYASIQVALAALDRLEVRGRDSAGLQVLVSDHALDLDDPTVARLVSERGADPLLTSGSVRTSGGVLAFVYKTAAEIGELGDNTSSLRSRIRGDELLRLALGAAGARTAVLGHTRWASVGIISEANAHPLDATELDREQGPQVVAVLNGDVDNHADLKAIEDLGIAPEITTDAKVIPTLIARRLAAGSAPPEAFRATVAALEGSVAVAAQVMEDPGRLFLALRGSGQALYVGCADDVFLVASEPYGLVEEARHYLRLDGETPAEPGNPASAGEVVVLYADAAGEIDGIGRISYGGTPKPVTHAELAVPEITTRDVDRGDHPHYLLKEIGEAPASFRKTLRGKIVERDGELAVQLSDRALPEAVRARLRAGAVRRVLVIGQGTAAVAGQSLAALLATEVAGRGVHVEAVAATELSGFGIGDDMSDTLVIAISQSGTTTDTNRTVDVVRARGGLVLSIVNRRQSDLVDKSDGVLYTSDGRDVEMSVASTKAFYAQVAAGFLLACALADELANGELPTPAATERRRLLLRGFVALPDAMAEVIARRDDIAAAARRHAPGRRSWAVVGNGPNRIAASEVRIKLSELCYKSIACDVTEDKKHIDLSSEPLVFVCAAGLTGSNADDIGKEIAIYRAHKAAPVVVASDGEHRFLSALDVLAVPRVHPDLDFVLSAMAGHLFGYEAALAIDASARPLREARAAIETLVAAGTEADDWLERLRPVLAPPADQFLDGLREGRFDGSLEAGTAVRLAGLLRYATGLAPLEAYQVEFGKVGTPSTLVEDLTGGLTAAIEELTRPVDAIKHQAKTVTVGISRSDETLLRVHLVQEVLAAGVARDALSYRALRTLVDLDAAVADVIGYTRYRIEGDPAVDATIHVVDRGGVATAIPSRTGTDPRLRGSKHRVSTEREVTVVRGRADGRTLVFVPEVKNNQTTGLALLHVRFHDVLPAASARRVLEGYRGRYDALRDAVTETEPTFRDELLGEVPLVDLLVDPVFVLAERWRST